MDNEQKIINIKRGNKLAGVKKIISKWFPDLIILLIVIFSLLFMFIDVEDGLMLLSFFLPSLLLLFLAVNKIFFHFFKTEVLARRKLYKRILAISLPFAVALVPGLIHAADEIGGAIAFYIMVPAFFIILLVFHIIFLVFFKINILKAISAPPGLTIILLLLSFWGSRELNVALRDSQSSENRAGAEKIIACLENYQKDNGRYPGRLDELVPQYCIKIPDTLSGLGKSEFRYTPTDGEYYLSYNSSYGWDETYLSSSDFWSWK